MTEVASDEAKHGDNDEEGAHEQEADAHDQEATDITAAAKLISWLVGVAFGRFDPRLAKGERPIPPEPSPFDPLPSRSPGMWPEPEISSVAAPDILVDDRGHSRDIVTMLAGASARSGVTELADVRSWLAHEFFPLHIKMYSQSRRKAPIYWQLATPRASYSVWLYIHAFTGDMLFRVQNEYVAPKLAHEQRQLEALRAEAGRDPTAAQRRTIETQELFVEELQTFLDEVKRVAPLWNPDLDDGVLINFAPLWRLVPQNKAWQKELRSAWTTLVAGESDWSHLAMHLWPDRVVPKCATDRSLAIAHGLEDVFWFEDEDGKWKPREEPLRSIDEIVKEQTSLAVKDALNSLMEAPATSGAPKRSRRRAA